MGSLEQIDAGKKITYNKSDYQTWTVQHEFLQLMGLYEEDIVNEVGRSQKW